MVVIWCPSCVQSDLEVCIRNVGAKFQNLAQEIFNFRPRRPTKMPAKEEDNTTVTRLLTLLNVSAVKSTKRRRFPKADAVDGVASVESIEPKRVKLNKRRVVTVQIEEEKEVSERGESEGQDAVMKEAEEDEELDSGDESTLH